MASSRVEVPVNRPARGEEERETLPTPFLSLSLCLRSFSPRLVCLVGDQARAVGSEHYQETNDNVANPPKFRPHSFK
jgi:hypothetical protein